MNCIIASGPVIIENSKVLLNRHGRTKVEQEIWKFVGGKVEEAHIKGIDTLEKTCEREVMEEMGIGISNLVPIKPMLVRNPHKPGTFVVLIHYLAKRIGEIKPGAEIIEWNWFDIKNLPENCAPNIKPVINAFIKMTT